MKKTLRARHAVTQAAEHAAKDLLAQTQPTGRVLTPDNTQRNSAVATCMAAWANLPKASQNQWLRLALQVNARELRAGRQRLNGSAMFLRINGVRLVCAQEVLLDCPVFESVTGLPTVALEASVAPNDALTLMLHAPPHDGLIQCFAYPERLPDQPVREGKAVLLGTLNGFDGTAQAISALYLAKMPLPVPDMKVCLGLVPISDAGFKGAALLTTAVVTETP